MICEKCQDRGFTEQEHGLVMVVCDCEAGKAKRAEMFGESGKASPDVVVEEVKPQDVVSIGDGITEGTEFSESVTTTNGTDTVYEWEASFEHDSESRDDLRSPSGDDLSNPTTGERNPSKPKLARKPKAKKKARAKPK